MFQLTVSTTVKRLVRHNTSTGNTLLLRRPLSHHFPTTKQRQNDVLRYQRCCCFCTFVANPMAKASATTTKQSYHPSDFGGDTISWFPFLGLGAFVTSTVAMASSHQRPLLPSRCDQSDDDETAASVDPYDNLPEQDEPTHCSICMTYRQGPCRPYWRKVEACTKDNEIPEKSSDDDASDDSDGVVDDNTNSPDPPCLKYMMPWIDCVSGYRNLYALIELDTNYTEGIADLEETSSQHFCWAPSAEPSVDWTPWQDYVELLNPDWELPRPTGHSNGASQSKQQRQEHVWKSLDPSEDPELVQIEAKVATTMGKGGILECAYALDQNNNVIGFVYGTKPSDATKAEKQRDNTKGAENSMATLKIQILPSRTRHVVLAAAYTHVNKDKQKQMNIPKKDNKDVNKDDALESHVYKSRPFQLDVMADRNTKINIASV
jgi:hypothetical protein